MTDYVTVAQTTDLDPGEGKLVQVKGKTVALFRAGDDYYALANTCTHRGGPLSEGYVEGHQVMCPWHGGQFDVRTGEAVGPPAMQSVVSYPVQVEGTDIKISVAD